MPLPALPSNQMDHLSLSLSLSHTTYTHTAPPPPDIVAVYAISSTSLVLSWQLDEGEIPGILANYTVTYRRSNSSEVGGVIPLPPGK